MKFKKSLGFTLSEVLIVIGILGIVAAMTIPAVVANHQKTAWLTSLEKNYNELSQNLVVLSTEKYNRDLYGSRLCKDGKTITGTAGQFLKDYYKIARDCGTTSSPCFARQYQSINGDTDSFSCSDGYNVLLKSGSAICVIPAVSASDTDVHIYLDINGEQKPNTGGKDMFEFRVNKKFEIYDEGDEDDCKDETFGAGCLNNVLNNNWRIDYY